MKNDYDTESRLSRLTWVEPQFESSEEQKDEHMYIVDE